MKKIAVLDFLNYSNPRHIGRYLPLLLELGPELSVFYCQPDFRQKFPKESQAISAVGIEIKHNYQEAAAGHDCFLASSIIMHSPLSGEDKVFLDRLYQAGKKLIYHPVSSEDVFPPAADFPAGSFILYPLEPTFFERMAHKSRYILDPQGWPVIGRTDHGVEGVVTGPLHHADETLALAQRDRGELKAELADRLKVKFKPNRPLVSYMPAHHVKSSYADQGLERLAGRAEVVVKLIQGANNPPSHDGRILDEVYCHATGESIYKTEDQSLIHLIRYASDVNLVNLQSSNFMTCFLLGRRLIPIFTQRLVYTAPREEFNFTLWFKSNLPAVKIMGNISPIEIRAADMLMDRIEDQDYWRQYDQALPILQKNHLGNYWLGKEAREKAVFYIKRVLEHGSFAPADTGNLRVIKGPVRINEPQLDFYHQYML